MQVALSSQLGVVVVVDVGKEVVVWVVVVVGVVWVVVITAASGEEYDAGTWKNYVYGSIHGVKFEDLDADGSFDFEDGEKGLTGVRFDLWKFDGTSTYTYDFNTTKPAVTYTTYDWDFVTSTYSMDHGEFWFTGLEPGIYVVREAISSGWNLSTGQPTNNPDTELSGLPSSPTASEVEDAFDGTYLGDNPDETSTGAFTIYSRDELVRGDVIFAATGVTGGTLLPGIRREPGWVTTETLLMRSKTGSVRRMQYRTPVS